LPIYLCWHTRHMCVGIPDIKQPVTLVKDENTNTRNYLSDHETETKIA
jgi:hypothetical protein